MTRKVGGSQSTACPIRSPAAVGEMGAGLAHELNNPLAGILGLVQVLQQTSNQDPKLLNSIEQSAQRCGEIVAQLLRFSRQGKSPISIDQQEFESVDLAAVISDALTLCMRHAGLQAWTSIAISRRPLWYAGMGMLAGALVQLLNSIRSAYARRHHHGESRCATLHPR